MGSFASALHSRYRGGITQWDSAGFVFLRAALSAELPASGPSLNVHHAHHAWTRVTRLHLTQNRFSLQTHPTSAIHSSRTDRTSTHFHTHATRHREVRHTAAFHTRTLVRTEHDHKLVRRLLCADRFTHCQLETALLKTLPREIVTRGRRVEQLPPRMRTDFAASPSPRQPMQLLQTLRQHRAPVPAAPATSQPAPLASPAAPPINLDALTANVIREIDSRLSATRERLRRT